MTSDLIFIFIEFGCGFGLLTVCVLFLEPNLFKISWLYTFFVDHIKLWLMLENAPRCFFVFQKANYFTKTSESQSAPRDVTLWFCSGHKLFTCFQLLLPWFSWFCVDIFNSMTGLNRYTYRTMFKDSKGKYVIRLFHLQFLLLQS